MRWLLGWLLVLGFSAFAAADADEAAAKELAALQGEWTLAKHVRNGEEMPEAERKKIKRSIKGNAFVIEIAAEGAPARKYSGAFKLNPTKSPKEIDLEIKDGPAEGQLMKAIYDLDGDTLRLCHDRHGAVRPTKFESEEGTGLTLSVWKKAKKADDR